MPGRPNVLFIMSDQHNAKFLGCTGLTDALTPALDRMASRGVRFANAVPQNTICTPSRICHLSGQYCHNHGHYALVGPHPGGLPTVLGHFRKAGWRTAFVGKSHGPEYWIEDDCDEFHDTTACAIGGRSPEYLAYLAKREIRIEDEFLPENDCKPSPFAYEDTEEGWGARKTIDIMRRSVADNKPFFLVHWPPKPHAPYTPAKRFWDLYDPASLKMPPNAHYDLRAAGKAPHLVSVYEWCRDHIADYEAWRKQKLHAYLANVTHLDYSIGEALSFLDDSGLAENTIVVYSSDHGEYVCEHGPSEKVPGIAADAVTRTPMIWQWPGRFKAGHVAREIAETVDIVPTLCALAGLEPLQTADGRDIAHMLAGSPGDPERPGVTEYPLSKSFRRGRWRMVYYPRGFFRGIGPEDFGELYDLEADPWEMKNLYFDPRHAETVRQLQRELMDWLVSTTRPATVQSPLSIRGDQTIQRHRCPVNADGKVPFSEFHLGLPGAPHL